VFYNEHTGVLMVRAAQEEMEIISAAIQTLCGFSPPEPNVPGSPRARNDNLPNRYSSTNGKTVSVLGQVREPGLYPLPAGETWTVVEAIAAAGGLAQNASDKKIELNRVGSNELKRYDFKELQRTSDRSTIKVEPGDIIVVGEKVF